MTRGEFRELVVKIADFSSNNYTDSSIEVNALINERIDAFCTWTHLYYGDQITLTITPNVYEYDMRGSSFSQRMSNIDRVFINGQLLLNFESYPGPANLNQLAQFIPGYVSTPSAQPHKWYVRPPNTFCLYPAPDQVYTCLVAGSYLPQHITLVASGDAQEVPIPSEYVRSCAYFTALALITPTATDQSDYQRLQALSSVAAEDMAALKSRNKKFTSNPNIRGTSQWVGRR